MAEDQALAALEAISRPAADTKTDIPEDIHPEPVAELSAALEQHQSLEQPQPLEQQHSFEQQTIAPEPPATSSPQLR